MQDTRLFQYQNELFHKSDTPPPERLRQNTTAIGQKEQVRRLLSSLRPLLLLTGSIQLQQLVPGSEMKQTCRRGIMIVKMLAIQMSDMTLRSYS